jgi:hypothetical protein
MSFEKLMAATHRLCASMDALAALGAELRVRQDGLSRRALCASIFTRSSGASNPTCWLT